MQCWWWWWFCSGLETNEEDDENVCVKHEYDNKDDERNGDDGDAESEKPRQRVSNADRKVFATSPLFAEEFPDILENVRILYKISR